MSVLGIELGSINCQWTSQAIWFQKLPPVLYHRLKSVNVALGLLNFDIIFSPQISAHFSKVPVFMYAATITKPQGGQSCNIFWPFEDDEDDLVGQATPSPGTKEEAMIHDSSKPHVLNGQTAFTFYSFFLGFTIPLLLILVFYVQVSNIYIYISDRLV